MTSKIVRPDLGVDKWKELETYLLRHWQRAFDSRTEQIDGKYEIWNKNYRGEPAEKQRSFPWPNASNFVVKLSRMLLDTFVARTLNIIFATRPLYVLDGFPSDLKNDLEFYLNRKALYEWDHYLLTKRFLTRGNKNGTAVTKTVWEVEEQWSNYGEKEELTVVSEKPGTSVIPFEDFYIYPITANDITEVLIKFHRIRFQYETMRAKATKWRFLDSEELINPTLDDLESWMMEPNDIKRQTTQEDAGIMDPEQKELQVIECHLKYAVSNDGDRDFQIVATICPKANKLLDVYFHPYPMNVEIFGDYAPYPEEDLFFGESMCQLLDTSQEEASQIHNARRDNSILANSVVFKRRNGSNIPNPSTNYYPGKVFDLESLEDLEIVNVGRNYTDMLQEEQFTIELAERLSGISPPMQGMAVGSSGKRGVYNTQGTLGVMAEGNQRQDTNIRDAREVLGRIGRRSFLLQHAYGQADPMLEDLAPEQKQRIQASFAKIKIGQILRSHFEVKTSNSGFNKEINKANLMQMAQVLGQYGATTSQLVTQLINPQLNPGIRIVLNDIVSMHRWMASQLLRAYDEYDTDTILPDVRRAIETIIPGGGRGSKEPSEEAAPELLEPGPAGSPEGMGGGGRAGLEALLQSYGPANGAPPVPGMGM